MPNVEIVTVNSLDKILLSGCPTLKESSNSMLKNERFHFQVCIKSDEGLKECTLRAEHNLPASVRIRTVDHVPCEVVSLVGHDDYVLSDEPGLYPDVLRELSDRAMVLPANRWYAAWVTVEGDSAPIAPGEYPIKIVFECPQREVSAAVTYTVKVIDAVLPDHSLKITNWMHYDCIAEQHRTDVFSDEYFQIFDKYLHSYVRMGNTMLLVPLFTPALDTKIGGERLTAQLVDITVKADGGYIFNFDRLSYFLEFVSARGIRYFEFSHLFTQWGAAFCPKIMGIKNGTPTKLFGWETASESAAYLGFLKAFLPAFADFLRGKGYQDISYFHLSDEPRLEHLERYANLKSIVKQYLGDFPIMDALSNYDFYKQKLVDKAVVALDHTPDFIKENAEFWVYYCTAEDSHYESNRFMAMPSQRNRILGMQLYLNGTEGFLQWGFNFYRSFLSIYPIDPYATTDCGRVYQSGDAFIVYPHGDGVRDSLRLEVFYDGLQDYRALCLLESVLGRPAVIDLLAAEGLDGFLTYPRSATWHIAFRQKINAMIEKHIAKR